MTKRKDPKDIITHRGVRNKHIPKGKERDSRVGGHSRTAIKSMPKRVLDGWENNGHVFEQDMTCKCGRTFKDHNADPTACPITLQLMAADLQRFMNAVLKKAATYKQAIKDITGVEVA